MNANSAIITPVLAAGSTTPPYLYQVNISQVLCSASCAGTTPVFNPTFHLIGVSQVGTNQYVATIHVEGIIGYVPCGGNTCCTKSQVLSQNFTIPIASSSAPEVTISSGVPVNIIAVTPCQTCSRQFVSEVPLSVSVA